MHGPADPERPSRLGQVWRVLAPILIWLIIFAFGWKMAIGLA